MDLKSIAIKDTTDFGQCSRRIELLVGGGNFNFKFHLGIRQCIR